MTKRQLKKIINDKNIKITCIEDNSRYTYNNMGAYQLNEVQRNILIDIYDKFSEYFSIVSDNIFKNDEQVYKIG